MRAQDEQWETGTGDESEDLVLDYAARIMQGLINEKTEAQQWLDEYQGEPGEKNRLAGVLWQIRSRCEEMLTPAVAAAQISGSSAYENILWLVNRYDVVRHVDNVAARIAYLEEQVRDAHTAGPWVQKGPDGWWTPCTCGARLLIHGSVHDDGAIDGIPAASEAHVSDLLLWP
jgi:hypothetical protein